MVRFNDEYHGYTAGLFKDNDSTITHFVCKYNKHDKDSLFKKSNRKLSADVNLEIITRTMGGKLK